MNRTLMSLSSLIASLVLVGCATSSTSSSPAAPSKPAVSAPTQADLKLAEKLKGEWTGAVMHAVGGGDLVESPFEKMILIATVVEGVNLNLDQTYYSPILDETKLPKMKAIVEKGALTANQAGVRKFELKMVGDNELVGDYHDLNTIWAVKLNRTKN